MIPAKTPIAVIRFFKEYIWEKPNIEDKIYLTFDDGPIPEVTPWVLDVLAEYDIKATFFCVGDNISKHPEIFKSIIDENHSIGNHTYNHLNGWKISDKDYLENFNKTQKLIERYNSSSKLFRPPYGRITRSQSKAIKNLGFDIIMWSVLSKDYKLKIKPQKVYENMLSNTKSGSIIVCHDNIKAFEVLKQALPRSIEALLEKGFVFEKL